MKDVPHPDDGVVRPVAVAIDVRHQGRHLLIKRANNVPAPGMWAPVTGRVEPGEALPLAAAREVAEEVGLIVEIGEERYRSLTTDGSYLLIWFDAFIAPDAPPATSAEDPGAALHGYPRLTLAQDEVADARWVTREEVEELSPMFEVQRAYYRTAAEQSAVTVTSAP